jgi:CheY-like chemotaxis protein
MISGRNNEATILIVEDDDGHAELIRENLQETGVTYPIIRLGNGQAALDFFYGPSDSTGPHRQQGHAYMMLLDIRMPGLDGIEVLKRIKGDAELRIMPVIMLTTTEDPCEIQNCFSLGCNGYITKPVDYMRFSEVLARLGLMIMEMQIPNIINKII